MRTFHRITRVDRRADFTKTDFTQGVNLHVHWGTPDAGVKDIPAGDVEGGEPNANVYDVVEVLDRHRLRVRPEDEGNRPVNGPFRYGPRACDIRWSTTAMGDIPREHRMFPHFCVVQVNNVFNNPLQRGGTRWVAYPRPHVPFQFYDALTGELRYAEAVHAR